jgi:hypothetical protein
MNARTFEDRARRAWPAVLRQTRFQSIKLRPLPLGTVPRLRLLLRSVRSRLSTTQQPLGASAGNNHSARQPEAQEIVGEFVAVVLGSVLSILLKCRY